MAATRQARTVSRRRAERELFFWTAHKTLRLVLSAAVTVYTVVSLLEGRLPGVEAILRMTGRM
jgi:hypothetical protein